MNADIASGDCLLSETANSILNVAAYKFVPLDNVVQRRQDLLRRCKSLRLRGTILLSPEGINLFLAGLPDDVQSFLSYLRNDPALANLETKDSFCDEQPFRRMLVRLKKEIIAFGVDSVRPIERTSPKLSAKELQRWLDEGRSIRLLDVRNDYEVDLGTFDGAEHLNIGHFREFPNAIEQLPEDAKCQPLVMFCTGGIRCEKAGPLMEQAGFEQVYQLDGGILKYFEECGSAHYQGSCFVFDNRVALDTNLQPTGNLLCFACQAVLGPEDLASDRFLFGQWCPNCYREPAERMREKLQSRQAQIVACAAAQPGSVAYVNERKMYVPGRMAGRSLLEFLCDMHPPTPAEQWQAWVSAGEIRAAGCVVTAADIVREGQCFTQLQPGTIEPKINPEIELIYEDEWLVVVNKPAPLPVHPSGRYSRNTLTELMAGAYPRQKLRVAHRLDANTTGLVVLCRTYQAARFVQPQFSSGQVQKRYLAKVHGHPDWELRACEATVSVDAEHGGQRDVDIPDGNPACTQFRVLRRNEDNSSLIEAIPLTGRTHQIRLHLWHLGHPVVGDPLYMPEMARGTESHTLSVGDPPMCLHAAEIAFQHPHEKRLLTLTAPAPEWHEPSLARPWEGS